MSPVSARPSAAGAGLVTFSGDKLLGGPQAGIIAGRADLVAACARHPLARALRPGGLVLGALQATALAYLDRRGDDIPLWRMVARSVDDLRARAEALGIGTVIDTVTVAGGGTLPGTKIESVGIAVDGDQCRRAAVGAGPPVIARMADGRTVSTCAPSSPTRTPWSRPHSPASPAGGEPALYVVATAGHVDHGKSTLVEALTGTDPDRWAEEKARGLTIDLGFAHTEIDELVVSFVDVPGHVRFLQHAGRGGRRRGLPVRGRRPGGLEAPVRGAPAHPRAGRRGHGVIALTKVDRVDARPGRASPASSVADRVAGTFLADAEVVDGGGAHGHRPRRAPGRPRTDPPGHPPAAADRGRPRLWVDRAFAARGRAPSSPGRSSVAGCRGRPPGGRPGGPRSGSGGSRPTTSRSTTLPPGSRTALNLVGVEHDQVRRGQVVVRAGQWHETAMVDADLQVLASLGHRVSRRGAYVAHLGTAEQPVRLRVLAADSLAPGTTGFVRLHLATALPLLPGDRYVLRESGGARRSAAGRSSMSTPVLPATRGDPGPFGGSGGRRAGLGGGRRAGTADR